jgi:hypothetical protein
MTDRPGEKAVVMTQSEPRIRKAKIGVEKIAAIVGHPCCRCAADSGGRPSRPRPPRDPAAAGAEAAPQRNLIDAVDYPSHKLNPIMEG